MEFVGALPLMVVGALVCVQALLLGLATIFTQVAVDRAVRGAEPAQVLSTIPEGWRSRAHVRRRPGGAVEVAMRPPVVLPGAGRFITVTAHADAVAT